jgi:hypothetical protein
MTKMASAFVDAGTEQLAIALSSLSYSPTDGLFWSVRDSGPGTDDWKLYLFGLRFSEATGKFEVARTVPIMWPATGSAPERQAHGKELDPEGAVFVGNGWWVCEEYKPQLFFVDEGGFIRETVLAPAFIQAHKVSGRGFEGLTCDPATGVIYTILQWGPFRDASNQAHDHRQTYILGWDPAASSWTTWTYVLEDPQDHGLWEFNLKAWVASSGIHCLGDSKFLVIERDNMSGEFMRVKQIWKAMLPAGGGLAQKELVADLLKMGYPFEKLEGVTIGPEGHVYVINDNDGETGENTTAIYHFKAKL